MKIIQSVNRTSLPAWELAPLAMGYLPLCSEISAKPAVPPGRKTQLVNLSEPRGAAPAKPQQAPQGPAARHVISAPLPFYEAYTKRHAQALRSANMAARKNVVDYVNKILLPRLPTEEAALQLLLAPIANMRWERGWVFSLFISKNLEQQPVRSYADHYVVQNIFSNPHGGFGLQLRPQEEASRKADLLLIPGTYCLRPGERDPLALAHGRPVGIRDDLRFWGIGTTSAANIKAFADACLAQANARGRKLVVAGHSLGAAVALRWMASLSPQAQRNVDLLAYVPPGLDRNTARSLEPVANNIRLFPHHWDVVRFSGLWRAPGREYMVRDYVREGSALKSHHAMPQLAVRELRGERPHVDPCKLRPARFVYVAPVVEFFRRLFGLLLWLFLPN